MSGGGSAKAWSGLLEAFHSVFIDEITDRRAEPRPVLGLPIRQAAFALPAEGLSALTVRKLALSEGGAPPTEGHVFLAYDLGFLKALGLEPAKLWETLLTRAAREFTRRNLEPAFEPAQLVALAPKAALPGVPASRVIWIPFQIDEGRCFLGMGI